MSRKNWFSLTAGLILGMVVSAIALHHATSSFAADATQPVKPDDLTALKAEIDRLKGMVPDQSHAMTDVGIHYTNLWFAGEHEDWPLAQFCFDEVRSHLRWAVRIIPVRKDLKGNEIQLTQVLGAMEATNLKSLGLTIGAKDKAKFETAYRDMMDSCYACHIAVDKPYLHLHVPDRPALPILDFETKKDPMGHPQ